ncbi:hypothetical protein [Corynebacterium alimapuense]|nr:hypothetical protein [Corynebacterium alimapuense]
MELPENPEHVALSVDEIDRFDRMTEVFEVNEERTLDFGILTSVYSG